VGKEVVKVNLYDVSVWVVPLDNMTYVVATELGAGVAAVERVQWGSQAILALSEWKLRELGAIERVQDTHLRLQVPLGVLVGHDLLMHDTRIIELGGPFRVLGNLFGESHRRKGSDCYSVLHDGLPGIGIGLEPLKHAHMRAVLVVFIQALTCGDSGHTNCDLSAEHLNDSL
jgi:hypothetical protein